MAGPTGNNAVLPQYPRRCQVKFVQGTDSAGTYKTLATPGGTIGANALGLTAVNTDTIAHNLTLSLINAAGTQVLNTYSLTASAGSTGSVLPIALLSPSTWFQNAIDGNGNPYIFLDYVGGTADTLAATFGTAFTVAASVIGIYGVVQDYDTV